MNKGNLKQVNKVYRQGNAVHKTYIHVLRRWIQVNDSGPLPMVIDHREAVHLILRNEALLLP